MNTLETQRLILSPLCEEDAGWVLALQQDPDWIKYIGDRGVSSLETAREYIYKINGQLKEWGFSLLAVRDGVNGRALGMCGLIRRPHTEYPDLGFALFPEARGKGVAFEASKRVIQWAINDGGYARITASCNTDNAASTDLLGRLGFTSMGNAYSHSLPTQRFFFLQKEELIGRA